MTEIPTTTDEISAEWLTGALDAAGLTGGSKVQSITRQRIGEGVGFIGELHRIALQFDGEPPPRCPRSLIAKIPTSDAAYRSVAQLMDLYGREHNFYRLVAARTDIRTPAVYYNAADAERQAYLLLLEDLCHTRVGDQLASCSADDARLALQEVARLHASWWQSPQLAELDWMPDSADPEYVALLKGVYQLGWPALLVKQGDELSEFPAEFIAIGERFGEHFDTVFTRINESPKTLAHYDYRLDNMLFDDSADTTRLVVIDWQLAHRSFAMLDVSYFLSGNFPVEVRRKCEVEMVHYYHDQLTSHGVSDYSFDRCWEDYRVSTLALLIFMVTSQNDIELSKLNDRAQALIAAIFERYTTSILDADAGSFLPA
jgi:hypothetical protein|tara:strand:+ start:5174 stop:6289 length:1116 start_codon:yes stop_codon:yes gene_type:complete